MGLYATNNKTIFYHILQTDDKKKSYIIKQTCGRHQKIKSLMPSISLFYYFPILLFANKINKFNSLDDIDL